MTIAVSTLVSGDRFYIPGTRQTGRVARQSPCGTVVEMDNAGRTSTFRPKDKDGKVGEEITIRGGKQRLQISGGTAVEPRPPIEGERPIVEVMTSRSYKEEEFSEEELARFRPKRGVKKNELDDTPTDGEKARRKKEKKVTEVQPEAEDEDMAGKGKKQTIGGVIKAGLGKKLSDERILAEVKKAFPDAKTTGNSIAFYRSQVNRAKADKKAATAGAAE